jgi:kumamolisin
MAALDRWFQAAAVLGMTVCFSSGDRGDGTMCDPPGKETFCVQFPACSPHVLAVGGTTLEPKAGTETAWKQDIAGLPMSGGGGFSSVFGLPPWQLEAAIDPKKWLPAHASSGDGRAIPDVAAKADYDTEFSILAGGTEVCAGGTSASVPFWAGLLAVLDQGLKGRAGSINRLLYDGTLDAALRDVTKGGTGYFHAEKGWDPCTGWGSPDGEALLRALKGQPEPRGPRRASAREASPRRR